MCSLTGKHLDDCSCHVSRWHSQVTSSTYQIFHITSGGVPTLFLGAKSPLVVSDGCLQLDGKLKEINHRIHVQ